MKRNLPVFSLLCMVLLALFCCLHFIESGLPECPKNPKLGQWYTVNVGDAVNSDGTPWHGLFRKGSKNRLMIYLLGGGVSIDAYSAARSNLSAGSDGFFYATDDGLSLKRIQHGIVNSDPKNPFAGWSVAVVPYTTADFHVGTGEAPYSSLQGENAAIYHNGFLNCMRMLDALSPVLDKPEALMIAGYSAGGFGAAMLAEDIIERFPDTQNITVCIDGALLIHPNWRGIAETRWHAPEHILNRMHSDNLTLDHLVSLNKRYGDAINILFTCSVRDGGLARYQSYFDGGAYIANDAYGSVMQEYLEDMVRNLNESIPGAGIFIWDDLPYGESSVLTRHTILTSDAAFEQFGSGTSIAQWMMDATDGRVKSYGLDLLQ